MIDYEKLELKVGLEIHQQLDTKKLFCSCSSKLYDNYNYEIVRMLRPTQSELGEVDKAAIEEAKKKLRFKYQITDNTCLVELDEEPPQQPNQEAIEIALTIAKILKSEIIDEINFMRKIVIDGSNTAGFQRTALIATGGEIKGIKIQTICLEEDAARKISEEEKFVVYRLDRLGIPLIEIATSPQITTPEKVKETAENIGLLLRATKVKRGLGTIRQDLNISIKGGARVEIKGVQELNSIPPVIENEVKRQLKLIEIKEELAKRNVELKGEVCQVTDIFKATKCKIFQNKAIWGVKLEGLSNLLGAKEARLGRELARRVKHLVKGIIHSDEELSSYGISEEEQSAVRTKLGILEKDAFVLIAGEEKVAKQAIAEILKRARECLRQVPEEVRRALPDNTTEYMRPIPGEARMYPETDIKPIITKEYIKKLQIPELPENKIKRFCKEYKISEEQARQLVYQGYDEQYEKFVKLYKRSVIARTFLSTIPELAAQGLDINKITEDFLQSVFEALAQKKFAKEAVPQIMACMLKEDLPLEKAIERTGLAAISQKELVKIINDILSSKKELIRQGDKAFAPLMGLVMEKVRGRIDGKLVARILKSKLTTIIKAYR
ncbi:MAG: Glu-tRNA(Gln) amidotransferase subunit GatE [Candidatus Thermoplasmatota archaeon]|nr:Glu-tRNA(Gln) amidotransferase subunit GatE [Candidatus Thermoplasmatota archaeon]